MKIKYIFLIAFIINLLSMNANAFPEDIVPNEETARLIAKAVIIGRNGENFLNKYAPLEVISEGEEWIVFAPNKDPYLRGGGGPELHIVTIDGRVSKFYYAK